MNAFRLKLALALTLAGALCACAAMAEQKLSGQWRDDQRGYRFHIEQDGSRVRLVADELFKMPNYADMVPGEVLGEGTFVGGKIVGRGIYFSHISAQKKCGWPAKELAGQLVLEISADGRRLHFSDTQRDLTGAGCQATMRVFKSSATRLPAA